MSALDHKQTFRSAIATSALPLNSGHVQRNSACPLSANSGHLVAIRSFRLRELAVPEAH
jgi:hypothetical protein